MDGDLVSALNWKIRAPATETRSMSDSYGKTVKPFFSREINQPNLLLTVLKEQRSSAVVFSVRIIKLDLRSRLVNMVYV